MRRDPLTDCASLAPAEQHGAAVELVAYFAESFGNATRIDYGALPAQPLEGVVAVFASCGF